MKNVKKPDIDVVYPTYINTDCNAGIYFIFILIL